MDCCFRCISAEGGCAEAYADNMVPLAMENHGQRKVEASTPSTADSMIGCHTSLCQYHKRIMFPRHQPLIALPHIVYSIYIFDQFLDTQCLPVNRPKKM